MPKARELARSFCDLEVYKRSRHLAQSVFEITKSFPKSETFSLTDQIRRSSRSIDAQIAEAWAKRKYPRHFLSKLTDADAEQMERVHWIGVAVSCGYVERQAAEEILEELDTIGRMLNSMMRKASEFCDNCSQQER
jgi:four helix bundle protein